MRASLGAVERVEIDKDTGVAEYFTIGGTFPLGICGTGFISLIANLFETGWLDAGGRLNKTKHCQSIITNGKKTKYVIAKESQNCPQINLNMWAIPQL